MIWLLGQYGDILEEAPYILEPWIDSIEDETSPDVRLQVDYPRLGLLLAA
jgi:hypothetical protein